MVVVVAMVAAVAAAAVAALEASAPVNVASVWHSANWLAGQQEHRLRRSARKQ